MELKQGTIVWGPMLLPNGKIKEPGGSNGRASEDCRGHAVPAWSNADASDLKSEGVPVTRKHPVQVRDPSPVVRASNMNSAADQNRRSHSRSICRQKTSIMGCLRQPDGVEQSCVSSCLLKLYDQIFRTGHFSAIDSVKCPMEGV